MSAELVAHRRQQLVLKIRLPALAFDLLDLFQMRQRSFGVSRSLVGMALFALIDRLFQMLDRFFGVRISLGLLTGLRVG